MGGLFSKKNRDYHASERGYTKRDEYWSSSGRHMYGSGNGDSRTLNRSYPTSNWSSTPSSPSMEGYSVGGSKTSSSGSNMFGSGNGGSSTLHRSYTTSSWSSPPSSPSIKRYSASGSKTSSSGSYMFGSGNSVSSKLHRSYTTSSWSSPPSSPSMKRYSAGGSKAKSYAATSLNAASKGRYGDLDSKTTTSKGYDAAAVGLNPNKASAAPVFRSATERGHTNCSAKPVLPKSHGTNNTSASLSVSTEGSYSTGRCSRAPATNSVVTVDVDRDSTKVFSTGGAGRGRGRRRGRGRGRGRRRKII